MQSLYNEFLKLKFTEETSLALVNGIVLFLRKTGKNTPECLQAKGNELIRILSQGPLFNETFHKNIENITDPYEMEKWISRPCHERNLAMLEIRNQTEQKFKVTTADIDRKKSGNCSRPCPKCHMFRVYAEHRQTRSADEGMTTFYQCLECNHFWRR